MNVYQPAKRCPGCGAAPGEIHVSGCDVERCPRCGGQSIGCGCIYEINGMDQTTLEEDYPDIYKNGPTDEMCRRWDKEWGGKAVAWSGEWPGVAECREFGWHSKLTPKGWKRCDASDPEAGEDLNRLYGGEAWWDREQQRWVRAQ